MLIPEVLELFRTGKLHPTDADWIGRLKPESQAAAARKCMNGNPSFSESMPKSSITHGHRGGTTARR
jgi:hypothetical protein